MQRELTFYPEIERTRDLLYSEYTSKDRSIHVLLQDNSAPQYRFLLEAYREIVSRYSSATRLQPPVSFLKELAGRLDELSKATQISPDDFRSMGLYVLLRARDAHYLFVSRADDIFVYEDGETLSLSQMPPEAVERVRFDGTTLQEELFPSTMKEGFLLFRLDPEHFKDCDIVLGCGEEDKSTVLEALSGPLWLGTGDLRNTVTSRFITRRVLALRFDVVTRQAAARSGSKRGPALRLALGVGTTAIAVVLALWVGRMLLPGEEHSAALERPSQMADLVVEEPGGEPAVGESVPGDSIRLTLGWKKSFGNPVTSSPVVHGQRVIFGCRDGNVYALDRETGERLWMTAASEGVGASVAVHGDMIVVADYGGGVSMLTADSGTPKWRQKLPMRIVSSPAVIDDRVVVGCYDGFAYCLSMNDGSILWKRGTGERIRAATAAAGDKFFVASYDGHLYALSVSTGAVEWRYAVGGNLSSAPVVHGDVVIIGSPDGSIHAVGAGDGTERWKFQTDGAVESSPFADDGFVFVGSTDKHVYCLNAADGSMVWKYETGDQVLARPRIEGDAIYIGSYDGYLYCLDRGTGELLDRWQSDGKIYSSPMVDDRSVYFGNNSGDFICLKHRVGKAL